MEPTDMSRDIADLTQQNKPYAVSIALKRMHDTVVFENLPDDFADLLAEIERKIVYGVAR